MEIVIAHDIFGDLKPYCLFCFAVKDLSPRLASFLQETPMKPSQVPNKLSHPPPRRMLPLQSPELCHRERLYHQGPIHSSGFIPNSPVNVGSSASRSHHNSTQPSGSFCSRFVPVSSANSDTTANRSQPSLPSVLNPASPQLSKDVNNHSLPSHIRSDEVTESQVTLLYSRSKNVMAQRQESNKVLFFLSFFFDHC